MPEIHKNYRKKSIFRRCLGVGLLLLSVTPVCFASETPFKDVPVGNSHFTAIEFLRNKDLVKGYPDGNFKPNLDINRAEALKMLLQAIPKKAQTQKNEIPFNFPDVKKEDWFFETVETAFRNKIIEGYPDTFFHPEKTLNRPESLKIVLLEAKTYLPKTVEKNPYSDVPTHMWYATFAQVSRERGLFLPSRNNDGEFLANETVTRGQFAELIYRLLQSNQGSKFGRATYYADSLAGRGMAGGTPYEPKVFTTAHKTLPFNTQLVVKNLANGKEVEVKVNDRGPYATGVELDLSKSAFEAIASSSTGIITVEYRLKELWPNTPTTQQTTGTETVPTEEKNNVLNF